MPVLLFSYESDPTRHTRTKLIGEGSGAEAEEVVEEWHNAIDANAMASMMQDPNLQHLMAQYSNRLFVYYVAALPINWYTFVKCDRKHPLIFVLA